MSTTEQSGGISTQGLTPQNILGIPSGVSQGMGFLIVGVRMAIYAVVGKMIADELGF